ncbi:MAG: nucleotidyltransferase domain-containing protein [Nitrospinae bacterium]|nr:nucleotidyltransferase domain-containing protein [Nitrospinota bacterium]
MKRVGEIAMDYYKDSLISIVVYGSVGRGDYKGHSDIDLLIVISSSYDSVCGRIHVFHDNVINKAEQTGEYKELITKKLPYRIMPIVYTVEELKNHPPLMLDMTEDSVILFDRDDTFLKEIENIKVRMMELGSKRIFLENGSWYWILKPDIKWGEIVKI